MDLQIFENPEFGTIRTVEIDGEIYFVGKDVSTALGYAKPENAIATHVDAEDKTSTLIQGTDSNYKSMAVVINESGLYSLIFSSKLPTAKEFKRWVTSEVLPKIRKYGVYANKDVAEEFLKNPKQAAKIFMELANERKEKARLSEVNAVLTQQVAELTPKASYYDLILNCRDLVSISKIAKDYGKSATEMNKILHELGVQYKQGKLWLLYQKYAPLGWTSTKTHNYLDVDGESHSKMHTYWTQKGRLGLYDLLKTNGYLPKIEMK